MWLCQTKGERVSWGEGSTRGEWRERDTAGWPGRAKGQQEGTRAAG